MFNEIDEMEEELINTIGVVETLNAILKALNYDQKKEVFQYLIRVYDLD